MIGEVRFSPVGPLGLHRARKLYDCCWHAEVVNLSLNIVILVIDHEGGVDVEAENRDTSRPNLCVMCWSKLRKTRSTVP